MTSSELVENAVKYGESVPAAQTVTLHARGDARRGCAIRVANGSTNAAGVAELQRRVQEMHRAEDKQALYIARLEEILAESRGERQLGDLPHRVRGRDSTCSSTTRDDVVTITATRESNG